MASLLLFFLSALICLTALCVERAIGIGWDFHPDAVTYLGNSKLITGLLLEQGPLAVLNNLYYLVVNALDMNLAAVIAVNVCMYSLTNVLITMVFTRFTKGNQPQGLIYFGLFALVLFNPYRIHLAVHVLKDTMIILFLVMVAVRWKFSFLSWLPLMLIRIGSMIYAIAFLTRRNLLLLAIPIGAYLVLHPHVIIGILESKQVDMRFRSFDHVPSFYSMGLFGTGLRALIWPFFMLTGTFVLFSPSVMFVPIAFGALVFQIWCWKSFSRPGLLLAVYAPMAILAIMVPGFTSFIRYALPLLTIAPILMMQGKMFRPR